VFSKELKKPEIIPVTAKGRPLPSAGASFTGKAKNTGESTHATNFGTSPNFNLTKLYQKIYI